MAQVATPSKITVPQRAHPAAKILFSEMRRQGMTYDELEFRSGVLKSTFKAWRTLNKPNLESLQATLGAVGWEFLPIPRIENMPPAVRELLDRAAEQWGSDDDLLCELLAQIATSPQLDRARLLASTAPPMPPPANANRKPRKRKASGHPDQSDFFNAAA